MLLLYLPVVLIGLYYLLYYYFTRNFNYWKRRNVTGPKPVALFGNLKEVALRRKNVIVVHKELYNMFPNEKVVGYYRMTTPTLLLRDLDIIKHVMIKDYDIFKDRGISFSTKGLGNNLFHADAETWTVLRSRFNPMFTPGKLKNMFPLLNQRSDVFISHLDKQCRADPEIDVYSLGQKYTISTIFACAFGVDFDPFVSEIDDTLKSLDSLILTPNYAQELDMMYPGLLKKLNLSFFPTKVTNFFENLVHDILTQRNGKATTRGDFMDLIITLRQKGEIDSAYSTKGGDEKKSIEITDSMVVAQAFVFYVAGYETSATTMAFLFYEVALRPEIQDKLRQEIISVMKANNGEISYDTLAEMKYLEKTFLETLRMHPIVDPLQRMALADYKVPDTDLVIEKNMMLNVSVMGIHFDEKHYPNPNVFDPDRFDPELVRTRHPCAYLPFGVGPRNCIGMRFGAMQGRLGVAKILSKYRVEICEKTIIPLPIKSDKLIMGPKDNVYLKMIPLTP